MLSPGKTWDFPPLAGHGLRLERADASHAPALFSITPPDTFRYFLSWPAAWTPAQFAAWFDENLALSNARVYVVIAGGRVVGSTAFLDLDPKNRCVEVGATWYALDARGTTVNPACKLLMLEHAIERLDCVRVTLKCNAKNLHSQAAIKKLGAIPEGVLRRHRVQRDGTTRDTAYFSVIAEEWPRVRAGLEARLMRDNPKG